ncbi:hyaluronan-binding protein 2-like [Gambusia affinis]|uniref:hyaluronan-binding protein 2-like n=1 Tax=Gambusia affinis TaxID=33528 RepID=UPI001CDD4269|nr:hyaluronan-binding protein 2-like [Gambusia affinis]
MKIKLLEVNFEINANCGNETTLPQNNGEIVRLASSSPPWNALGAKPKQKSHTADPMRRLTGRTPHLDKSAWPALSRNPPSTSTPAPPSKNKQAAATKTVPPTPLPRTERPAQTSKHSDTLGIPLKNRFSALQPEPLSETSPSNINNEARPTHPPPKTLKDKVTTRKTKDDPNNHCPFCDWTYQCPFCDWWLPVQQEVVKILKAGLQNCRHSQEAGPAMALLKVLLLLLGLGVSMNSHASLHKRIIGGQNCDDKERLYHVRLERDNGTDSYLCGGSLIHRRWILTVAHCWRSQPEWTMRATLGVHPRNATQETQTIQHNPVMYFDQREQRNDIMLLRLQRPVRNIRPVRLPRCNNRPKIGAVVQLAGEGPTSTNPNDERYDELPSHLQCVDLRINRFTVSPTRGYLIVTQAPDKEAYFGDSGGGVVLNNKIYGVISGGVRSDPFRKPIYSMIVCEYIDWIRNTTGLNKPKLS